MGLRINHDFSAMGALRASSLATRSLSRSLEQLSSGLRINRASDDAASLSISENLRSQVRGRQQALANAQDNVSLVRLADGALNELTSSLQRIRELAVQAANGTQDASARAMLQAEVDQLVQGIDSISADTTFNTKVLLDGSLSNHVAQVGANEGETLTFSLSDLSAGALGLTGTTVTTATTLSSMGVTAGTVEILRNPFLSTIVTINPGDTLGTFFSNLNAQTGGLVTASLSGGVISLSTSWIVSGSGIGGASTSNFGAISNLAGGTWSTAPFPANNTFTASAPVSSVSGMSVLSHASASQAISTVDAALGRVNDERAKLGAIQNRLESTISNLSVGMENMMAAESRLRDVDFAAALTALSRAQILRQSSISMVAQANMAHGNILELLA